jgi:hypothetical protein
MSTLTKHELYAKLSSLMDKQRVLMDKLSRSFRIEALWPDAFKACTCTAFIVGSPSAGYELVLRRADGEERRYVAASRAFGRELLREQIAKQPDSYIGRAMKRELSRDVWKQETSE